MTEKTKDSIKSALFEAGFVVLGVLLALAANEWRQARADDEQSRQALVTIVEELKANRTAISASMEYHTGLMQVLWAEHEDDWVPSMRDFSRGFIFPARVSRTAWDSASETGAIAKTDFSLVVEISGIYAQQERYEAQARSIGEVIYGELFRGGTEAVARNYRNLGGIISTFAYREKELLARYDETLASLNPASGVDDH